MTNDRNASIAALLLRVSMGAMFLAHSVLLKIMEFTPAGTAQYFESIGYPGFLAYVVIAAELGGGLLLIAGIRVRWVSLAFIPLMIGATLQHVPNGWMFGYEGGGWEFPVFWTVALAALALLGNGALSAERLLVPARESEAVPALA
jgi:putative oxidoreductase